MIKTKLGDVKIEGTLLEVRADLTVIIRALKASFVDDAELSEEEASDIINECVEIGLLSEDETRKVLYEKEKEFLEKKKELVKELLEKLFGVQEEEANE